jgi:toxin YoeB
MKDIKFSGNAYEELLEWVEEDPKMFEKIKTLLKEISSDPFKGTGKPEPLKYNMRGWWSRRINSEHRIIYKMEEGVILVNSLKGHYDD